jgi:hypothetical protein
VVLDRSFGTGAVDLHPSGDETWARDGVTH